ncbi:hypothetical protein WR25_08193 [Diploscapter pachys]|uniref:Uncharacterized protein n=1 Tax=Diploscapter pachys TaxID=2018661 RepID=A0A2A2L9W5_9BILA|nr:hypothetical protein WR25_08193 [Diploscapter pachys]
MSSSLTRFSPTHSTLRLPNSSSCTAEMTLSSLHEMTRVRSFSVKTSSGEGGWMASPWSGVSIDILLTRAEILTASGNVDVAQRVVGEAAVVAEHVQQLVARAHRHLEDRVRQAVPVAELLLCNLTIVRLLTIRLVDCHERDMV